MNDSLLDVTERVQANAELFRVGTKRLDLSSRGGFRNGLIDVDGRSVVILCGDSEVGPANRTPRDAKTIKSLGARHFMDEVEIDIDQVGLALLALLDKVISPQLFCECAGF
jgi:hypothetical protein